MSRYERQTEPTPDSTRVRLSLLGEAREDNGGQNIPMLSSKSESLRSETGVAGVPRANAVSEGDYATAVERAKRVRRAWRDSNPRSRG